MLFVRYSKTALDTLFIHSGKIFYSVLRREGGVGGEALFKSKHNQPLKDSLLAPLSH